MNGRTRSRSGRRSPPSSATCSRPASSTSLNVDRIYDYLGGFIVAGITAGAVYSKERLNEAKRAEKAAPKPSSRKRGAQEVRLARG